MSYLSTYVAGNVYKSLKIFVRPRRLGWVSPEGATFQCFPDDPDRVRKADASFISINRFTEEQATSEGHCTVAPDLVVEVISPNDRFYDVERKIEEWLAAGVRVVWIINPETKTVRILRATGSDVRLHQSDTLTCEELLPGFSCPVADLFRLATEA